jgi:hypothetical protein
MQNEQNQTQPIEPQMLVQPAPKPVQVPVEQNFEPTKKSLPKWPLIIAGVILLATLLTGTYLLGKNQNTKIACTLEAKICPDGSSVGRTGPKCEFSPCPKTKITTLTTSPTADWKTEIVAGMPFSFKYPSNWSIKQNSNNNALYWFDLTDPTEKVKENIRVILYSNSIEEQQKHLSGGDASLSYQSTIIGNSLFEGRKIVRVETKHYEYNGPTNPPTLISQSYQIWIASGNNTLSLSGDISYKSLLEQMLSTFKFTQ